MFGRGLYFRDIHPVGHAYSLSVYLLTPDDENLVVRASGLHGHSK